MLGLTDLNRKLIIAASFLGALAGLVLGYLIFFGLPGLSNFNVEEYIALGISISASFAALYTYLRAASHKSAHALLVFCGAWLFVLLLAIFLLILLIVYCSIWSCRIIPFL